MLIPGDTCKIVNAAKENKKGLRWRGHNGHADGAYRPPVSTTDNQTRLQGWIEQTYLPATISALAGRWSLTFLMPGKYSAMTVESAFGGYSWFNAPI